VTPTKSISQSKSKAQRFDGVDPEACGEPVATAMIHMGPNGVPKGPRTPLDLPPPPTGFGETPVRSNGRGGFGRRSLPSHL